MILLRVREVPGSIPGAAPGVPSELAEGQGIPDCTQVGNELLCCRSVHLGAERAMGHDLGCFLAGRRGGVPPSQLSCLTHDEEATSQT